jgi:hypothetical protein
MLPVGIGHVAGCGARSMVWGGGMTEIDDEHQNLTQMHELIRDMYMEHTKK